MKIVKLTNKLASEEKESHLNYDYLDKVWIMDTTIMTHYNKCLKQGWELITQYEYADGSIAGGVFKGTNTSITIRNPVKRPMSEAQKGNLKKKI